MPVPKKKTMSRNSSSSRGGHSSDQKGNSSLSRAPKIRTIRNCAFCDQKTEPTYTDSMTLKKYMSDRSRIMEHHRTGACSKHQRRVTKEIKHARHLALLPFVAKV